MYVYIYIYIYIYIYTHNGAALGSASAPSSALPLAAALGSALAWCTQCIRQYVYMYPPDDSRVFLIDVYAINVYAMIQGLFCISCSPLYIRQYCLGTRF